MADAPARTIKEQVAWELQRRPRIGLVALAAGVIYLVSGIVATTTLRNAPTVGLVQAITPALRGEADPKLSPRAAEVRYLDHHSLGLLAGSVLAAIAIAGGVAVLIFLVDAVRYRRPETIPAARRLTLYGGATVALLSVISQVVNAINTHNFVKGHDFTNHAVDRALSTDTARVATAYLGLVAELALAAGVIVIALNAMRTGLLTRFMGIVGIIVAVLLVLPIGGSLPIVPSMWLIGLGVLLLGRWPSGDPPAWGAGEARPWPSQAELREARQAGAGGTADGGRGAGRAPRSKPADARSAASPRDRSLPADAPPEPAVPARAPSSKRKRKRGARR